MVTFEEFKALYDELDPRDKAILAKSNIFMETEEDVERIMEFMRFMQKCREGFNKIEELIQKESNQPQAL